jgi:hypothetical protein
VAAHSKAERGPLQRLPALSAPVAQRRLLRGQCPLRIRPRSRLFVLIGRLLLLLIVFRTSSSFPLSFRVGDGGSDLLRLGLGSSDLGELGFQVVDDGSRVRRNPGEELQASKEKGERKGETLSLGDLGSCEW